MSTRLLRPAATVDLGASLVKPRAGAVTLDTGWSPYVQAQLTLPAHLDVDPRDGDRAVITASNAFGVRVFDLGVRSRTISADRRQVALRLASDEAILQDYVALVHSKFPWPSDAPLPLRQIVGGVLNTVFDDFDFAAGPDADVRPFWELRNLFRDPSVGGIENFTPGTGASALQVSTTVGGAFGSSALRWTAAAGASNVVLGSAAKGQPQVTAGKRYNVSVYIRSSISRNANLVVRWYDAQGVQIKQNSDIATATPTGNWNTRLAVGAVAPQGASYMSPVVTTAGNTAGQFHYIDGIQITQSERAEPFFYGGSPNDAFYTYAWDDVVNDSTSVRVPVLERSPDMLVWKTGQSAWDYLDAIVLSAGLRLYCDEARTWRLVAPDDYAPGLLSVTAGTITQATDVISRDGDVIWATGAAVHYVWDDADLGPQEKWDVAGTPEKVLVIEKRAAYPGPGAAAAALAAMRLKGRVQDLETFTEYETTPTQELHIALPGAPQTVGRVAAVTFDLVTGLMQVASKGLGEIPADSWEAVPDAEVWTDPPDITWDEWT